jgi:hypothetical protein
VHKSSTVAAVHDQQGKSLIESILKTEAGTIRRRRPGCTRSFSP